MKRAFSDYKEQTQREIYKTVKASHRVMASYHIADADKKIALLLSAIELDPKVFNGYNALGWTYVSKGELNKAANAFQAAIHNTPEQKEGYFDLAATYLKMGDTELCLRFLRQAVKVDPASKTDLLDNSLFQPIWDNAGYKDLLK
ncbi:MAG: tetratricopeptide repeat protein [Nitrospirae bacterium]|nr:tetratricopeptide repeat protein [Nitrospirota bacterium]MBF0591524.1 tetratricopeptide repeat protein [Nitrospirota bacterium]